MATSEDLVRQFGDFWYRLLARPDIMLQISACDAWILMSALQLTTTHPLLGDQLKEVCERIGRQLQSVFAEDEYGATVADAGWHRQFDR